MRATLFLAVALAACGGASHPAPSNAMGSTDSITLTYAAPRVGASWTEEKTSETQMSIDTGDGPIRMVGHEDTVKRWTVLAASAEAITKATVTYVKHDRSQQVAGTEQVPPSVIVGKTFTLEGSPPTITVDGAAVPPDESKQVLADEPHFGEPEKMGKLLAGRTFERDQAVDLPPDEIAHSMGDDKLDVTRMTLTYRGMNGRDASFDIALDMAQQSGGATISFSMAGSVSFDPKTNELHSMKLEGPISMTGTASGNGTMSLTETHTP